MLYRQRSTRERRKSNQEIAEKLIVGLRTVKAHASNIYRDLDVRNRSQTIIAEREISIL